VLLRTTIVALVLTLLTVVPHAQDRPDFTGRWTLVPERSVIQGRDRPIIVTVFGTDFTVQSESNTLLVRVAPDLAPTWRVNLDGTPTLHAKSEPDDRIGRTTVTATWEGETLVMHLAEEVVRNGESVYSHTRRCLTLNPDRTLRVEMPDGQDGRLIASVYRWLEPMP
jgi:hypothetical protein